MASLPWRRRSRQQCGHAAWYPHNRRERIFNVARIYLAATMHHASCANNLHMVGNCGSNTQVCRALSVPSYLRCSESGLSSCSAGHVKTQWKAICCKCWPATHEAHTKQGGPRAWSFLQLSQTNSVVGTNQQWQDMGSSADVNARAVLEKRSGFAFKSPRGSIRYRRDS